MVNLKTGTIKQGEKEEPILRFTVVFQTPLGWSPSLDEAVRTCAEHDFDPCLCVVPVPVAVSSTMQEVMR